MSYDWSQYKKVKLRFICLFALTLPIMFLIGEVGRSSIFILFPLWFAWGLAVLVPASFKLGLSLCPRCKKSFHFKFGYGNIFKRSCLHCGLKLYQKSEIEEKVTG